MLRQVKCVGVPFWADEHALIHERARELGLRPKDFVRQVMLRALGIITLTEEQITNDTQQPQAQQDVVA